ncbi:MAG: hypothetical protein KA974_12070 [Saprospiraceae bacterium]|nr:hypothetical protein [Saprospiraceae bacterium]
MYPLLKLIKWQKMIVKILKVFQFGAFPLLVFGFSNVYCQIPQSNLLMWINADSVQTISSKVSTIYDMSGRGFDLFQPNSSGQPTLISNGLNGYPVLRFNGTSNFLNVDFGQTFNHPISIYCVFKVDGAGIQYIYDGKTAYQSLRYNSGSIQMRVSSSVLGYVKSAPFPFICSTAVYNGSLSKIYQNSILEQTGVLSMGFLNGFTLGSLFSATNYFFKGDLAELIVYNNELTSIDQLIVENYLMDKYTPVFSLGDDINVGYGICDTVIGINSGFSNYIWSTGATTNTILVNKSGQYSVTAFDSFGRAHYDTINVVFPLQIENKTICFGDTLLVNPIISGNYSFLWFDLTVTENMSISTEGIYWLEVTDDNGCVIRDTFFVDVDSFPQRIDLGADTSLCSGNQIRLMVGENLCSTFLWLPGNETTPQRTVTESGLYKLTATNTNGCTASDSLFVSIQGLAPTPVFTVDNLCFGDVVQCNDFSVHPDSIQSFTWIFNATDTLYSQNPQYQFAAPGTHSIRLVLESFSGCVNDSVAQVVVKPLPEVSFSWLPVCAGIPVDFDA